MSNWDNTTYPCDGNVTNWVGVAGCSNGMVTQLSLRYCGLDGTLPSTWGALPGMEGLVHLELWGNQLKGPLPAAWAGLKSLQVFYADHNQLTGPLPESWANMPKLAQVHAYGSQLTGTLPASWGGIKSLMSMFFGNNRLKGPLPASWGNLTRLQGLELYNNTQLTGTLPPSWGGLNMLEILGLSNNTALIGTVPCSWSSIGSKSNGRWAGGVPGTLFQLCLGGSGLQGCYPSAGLKEAGDRADKSCYQFAPSPVSGVPGG
jgi:hypothetical protein